jgi:DNA-binding transcriptional ArsR family regulator
MTDYVAKPDLRILDTLTGLCAHQGRLYTKVSQGKILELCEKFTGRRLSLRTLSRHLGALTEQGYIRRQRRHDTAMDGTLVLRCSLYMLAKRAVQRARKLTSSVWNWSTAAAKSLMDVALPLLAETLDPSGPLNTKRAAHAPPKR